MTLTDDDLTAIRALVAAELAKVSAPRTGAAPAQAQGGAIAPDSDLDGKYGNPEIKRDPPRWKGDPIAPRYMADCPADYLETFAGFKEWQAGKDEAAGDEESRKKAGYARKDAARARGWAARNRAKPPTVTVPATDAWTGDAGDPF